MTPSTTEARALAVRWSTVEDSDGEPVKAFEFEYRKSGTAIWTSATVDDEMALAPDLDAGVKYWFRVRGVAPHATARAWSALRSTNAPIPPPRPEALTAEVGDQRALLKWTANVPSEAAYDVRYRLVGADSSAWTVARSDSSRELAVENLVNAADYEFQVRAVAQGLPGDWSATLSKRIGSVPTAPALPTVRLADRAGQLVIRWQAPQSTGGPVTSYEVHFFPSGGAGGKPLSVEPTATSQLVSGLTPGVRYLFRVRASNAIGTGGWSPIAGAVSPKLSLPVFRINTAGSTPIDSKTTYVAANAVLDPNGTDAAPFSAALTVRGRGNSTWTLPKKPYRLKFDKSTGVLGMPKSKHWVLLANYLDRTHLRSAVAYELGRSTSLGWTPRSRFVELIVNNEFLGVYQIAEHVRVAADRVNIDEMTDADREGSALTGGYLLELDYRLDTAVDPGFRTVRNLPIKFDTPEAPTTEQRSYIQSYVQSFETALFSSRFRDVETGYLRYIDRPSFIDWYLVEELTRNHDAWYSSGFMNKPRGGKLRMGPLWDFDLSQGSPFAGVPNVPEGWWVRDRSSWFKRLFEDPDFAEAVALRWRELRTAVAGLGTFVDTNSATLNTAIGNDKALWGYSNGFQNDIANLKGWLATRANWLDKQFGLGPS